MVHLSFSYVGVHDRVNIIFVESYIIYFHSVDPYRITKSILIWK